jgi:serine/threonine-protein kinase
VQEEPGFLQVVVRPWAEVAVDGRTIGETPLGRITLSAGTHRVRVRHPAYEAVERTVTVRAGAVERLTVDLPTEGVRRP